MDRSPMDFNLDQNSEESAEKKMPKIHSNKKQDSILFSQKCQDKEIFLGNVKNQILGLNKKEIDQFPEIMNITPIVEEKNFSFEKEAKYQKKKIKENFG